MLLSTGEASTGGVDCWRAHEDASRDDENGNDWAEEEDEEEGDGDGDRLRAAPDDGDAEEEEEEEGLGCSGA